MMVQERPFTWTFWGLLGAGAILVSLLVWQLMGLTPTHWCGASIGAARAENTVARDCTQILIELLKIKDHALMIFGGTLAIVVIALVAAAAKVNLSALLPGGGSVNVSSKDDDA